MKTRTIKLATAIVATAMAITFVSCKKGDKGDPGAAGTPGNNGVVPTYTDGFIKGTISGTREDGTAFNETFNYTNYFDGPAGELDSNNAASFDFIINRANDVFGDNAAGITVNTTSKTATSGNITLDNFRYQKSLGTNKWFVFKTNASPTASITGLSYTASSGMFTGSFSFTVPGFQNSTGNSATITGSFQATMTQVYNMVKHDALNSAK